MIRPKERRGSGGAPDTGALKKPRRESRGQNRRWIMPAAMALMIILAVSVVLRVKDAPPRPRDTEPSPLPVSDTVRRLVDRTTGELTAVTVTPADGGGYTLTVTDGAYGMKDAPGFIVDPKKAGELALACAAVWYDGVLEAPRDSALYGLDTPAVTVRILFSDQTERVFELGALTPGGTRYYLREWGKPEVYLAFAAVGEAWTRARGEMRSLALPEMAADRIGKISLSRPGSAPLTVGYEPDRQSLGVGVVWLTSPVVYEADLNKVDACFRQIASLGLKRFVADVNPDELALFALEPPRYTLTVYGKRDVGGDSVLREFHIGGECDGDAVYMRIEGMEGVFAADRASLAFLDALTVPGLIDRYANIIYLDAIDRIRVTADGAEEIFEVFRAPSLDEAGQPRLNLNGQPMMAETFTLCGEPVEDAAFRRLYRLIIGTRVDGMLPDGWTPDDDTEPVLTVAYRLIGRHHGAEEEIVEYLPYNADHYGVRRNGVSLFYILKTRVDIIPQSLAAYHAGTD